MPTFSWVSVAVLGALCLILSRLMLEKWQENILFFDGIAGILISTYSASVSVLLATNSQLLSAWIVVCTVIVLSPVLWWMPFVGKKEAERVAFETLQNRPNTHNIRIEPYTRLDRWTWRIYGRFVELGAERKFRASVSAKYGDLKDMTIRSIDERFE